MKNIMGSSLELCYTFLFSLWAFTVLTISFPFFLLMGIVVNFTEHCEDNDY